jgi:hypothetical protein
MDIDLVSPLSIEECQKRLDAALVHYSALLPFWNWPPRKMTGSRSGFGFTLDPRRWQFYNFYNRRKMGGKEPLPVPFLGLLSESGSSTHIQGSFDAIALQSYRSDVLAPLLTFTLAWCGFTGLFICVSTDQSIFDWTNIQLALKLWGIPIVVFIYFWSNRKSMNPPGIKKIRKFLKLTLDAKETTVQ